MYSLNYPFLDLLDVSVGTIWPYIIKLAWILIRAPSDWSYLFIISNKVSELLLFVLESRIELLHLIQQIKFLGFETLLVGFQSCNKRNCEFYASDFHVKVFYSFPSTITLHGKPLLGNMPLKYSWTFLLSKMFQTFSVLIE